MLVNKNIQLTLLGFLLIILSISAPWIDTTVSNHSFVKSYIAGIGSGFLFLLTLTNIVNKDKLVLRISYIKITLLALFMLGTLSILWSNNIDFSINKWLIWLNIFFIFNIAYNLNMNYNNLVKLSMYLTIAGFIIAIIGIWQHLFNFDLLTQAAPPSSTFGNKNMATQPLILILPLTFFLFISLKNYTKIILTAVMITTIAIFIFYTKTRSAWLAIIVEIIFIIIFATSQRKQIKNYISWNKIKTIVSVIMLTTVLVFINFDVNGFNPFWHTIDHKIMQLSTDITNNNYIRYHIYDSAINMIKDSPIFGSGLGTWFHNEVEGGYNTYKVASFQRVHNDVLELGVELGSLGVLIFLMTILSLVKAVIVICRQNNKLSVFYFFITVALAGSFTNMQFSFPYQLAVPATLFGLYAGLIAKQSELFIIPIKEITIKLNALIKKIIYSFFITIFLIISWFYIEWIATYTRLNKFYKYENFNRLQQLKTTIYHLELQNILAFLSNDYLHKKQYNQVLKIEKHLTNYWPNSTNSLYRYAFSLYKLKQYNKALKIAKIGVKSSGYGMYSNQALLIQIYHAMGDTKNGIKAFIKLSSIAEQKLKLSLYAQQILIAYAMQVPVLFKYIDILYAKFIKYSGYSCIVENNMAAYYVYKKQYIKAAKHSKNILLHKENKCINNNIVKILKNKGLLN